jgi:hypothetical protein
MVKAAGVAGRGVGLVLVCDMYGGRKKDEKKIETLSLSKSWRSAS